MNGNLAALLRRKNAVGGHRCKRGIRGGFRRCPNDFARLRLGDAPFTLDGAAAVETVRRNFGDIGRVDIVRNHRLTDDFDAGNFRVNQLPVDFDFNRFGNRTDGRGNGRFSAVSDQIAATVQTGYNTVLVHNGNGRVGGLPFQIAGISAGGGQVVNRKLCGLALVNFGLADNGKIGNRKFRLLHNCKGNGVGKRGIQRVCRIYAHLNGTGRGKGHEAVGRNGCVLTGFGIQNRVAHCPFHALVNTNRRNRAVQLHGCAHGNCGRNGIFVGNMYRGRHKVCKDAFFHNNLDFIRCKHLAVCTVQGCDNFNVHAVQRRLQAVCERIAGHGTDNPN